MQADSHTLEDVYLAFAGDKEMDGKSFAKLSKDCNLLDKKLTSTDVDLVFAKIRGSGHRKINFDQFKECIHEIAKKKGISEEEINESIVKAGGPHFHGTKALHVKLHDDKSQYTGVCA